MPTILRRYRAGFKPVPALVVFRERKAFDPKPWRLQIQPSLPPTILMGLLAPAFKA